MSDQKLSTDEILAKIRGGGSADANADDSAEAPAAASSEPPAAEEAAAAPAAESAPAAPAGPAPTNTADILASIKGGGAPKPAAAAKPAAAPGGTSDILASIRGGGGAAKPAAAAPKAKAAKAKPVDTAKAAGMSAAEMIAAARKGVVTADPVTGKDLPSAKKPALPKKPLKAPVLPKKKKETVERRSFLAATGAVLLSPVIWAWTSLVTATAAASLGVARFMMPNVLVEPPTKFKIGPPTDYGAGTVSTKWKAQFGVWIVNDEIDGQQMVYALSTVCTHLGCTPNWLEGEQKFKCPCHGSGFYKTGINFEGPAPRPLERHGIRLAEDGMLEVDKSVKFQRELGQWENSSSFVPV